MNSISNFAGESIQNKIILVPAVAVGAFLGSRAVAGALALSLKGAGTAANFIGVNTLGENLHASGDQLINFATRKFGPELKISMNLAALSVVGVGAATILTPPEVSLLKKVTDCVGLTIPAPTRLKGLTDAIGLTSQTTFMQNFPNSLPYKVVEKVKTDYLMEIPAVRFFRGLPLFEGNPILTNVSKDFSNLRAGLSNMVSTLLEDIRSGRVNMNPLAK
jgi:hypothetical protein